MTPESQTGLLTRPVGEIAAAMPGAIPVLRRFKVNFCCGGELPLGEAAAARGLDPAELARALAEAPASTDESLAALPSDALIDHVLSRYHETHRREFPELIGLARKVEAVHADHPRVPRGLADLLYRMWGALEVHMKKEELILFPAMRRMAGARLAAPIGQMRHDHADHGALLGELADLTGDFVPPDGACGSWQALCTGSAKLSADLMAHINAENFILFPRFEGGDDGPLAA